MKNGVRWLLIFSLLGLYTYSAITTFLSPSSETVYAQTIANNDTLQDGDTFLVVDNLDQQIQERVEEQKQAAFQRVLSQFRDRVEETREVCQVADEDLATLQQSRNLVITTLSVNGRTVSIATNEDNQPLSAEDIPSAECIRFSIYEQVLLQLTAQLS